MGVAEVLALFLALGVGILAGGILSRRRGRPAAKAGDAARALGVEIRSEAPSRPLPTRR